MFPHLKPRLLGTAREMGACRKPSLGLDVCLLCRPKDPLTNAKQQLKAKAEGNNINNSNNEWIPSSPEKPAGRACQHLAV